jgi:hypothetical protein
MVHVEKCTFRLAHIRSDEQLVANAHAFLKKLAILPCALPPDFLPFAVLAGLGAGFAFLGSGSSSENDSQTASSLVTAERQRHQGVMQLCAYQDSHPHP